jgi:precorrin-4 methylase
MVSMGVGDPDLITVRAIKAIEKSDIIICRPGFRKTFARYLDNKTFWDGAFDQWRTYGRQCSRLENRQEQQKCLEDKKIRQKLTAKIRAAIKEGKIISVLGSGDLFIYGGPYRWYRKELEDIDIETIPGVSSLNAANAVIGKDIMAGDPVHSAVLTHYHGIDKLAHHRPTMIIFTMHTKFSDIVEKLKSYYPPQTPIAVVFYAGYKDRQYQIKGNLNNIIHKTEKIDFPFEHLVYVGGFMK